MDRVRRISEEILAKYPNAFGTDYQTNKEQLNKIAIVHSKMLRNKIAGYITKILGNAATNAEEEEAAREEGVEATEASSETATEAESEAVKTENSEEAPPSPPAETAPPVQDQKVAEEARAA